MFRPLCLQWLFGFLSWILPVFSVYCGTTWFGSAVPIYLESPHFGFLSNSTFPLRVATHYRWHVAATRRGDRSLLVHRSGDMLRDLFQREIVSSVLESLCTQQNFVATIRTNSNWFDFAVLVTTCCVTCDHLLRYLWPLVAVLVTTCCITCDHLLRRQISIYTSRLITARCLHDLSLQLYTQCVLVCLANVSVWFQSKERHRNGISGFGRARNETRALSLTLVPRSLFRNCTETLATQAKCVPTLTLVNCWGLKPVVYFVWFEPSKDRIGVYLIISLFQSQRAWLISPFPSCFLLKLLTKRDWWRRKRLPFAFGENQLLSCEILSFMNTAKRNDAPDNLEQRILDIPISR